MGEKEEFLKDFYENYYTSIYNSSGLAKWAYNETHCGLERFDSTSFTSSSKILEIGAGKGEHYPFVSHEYGEYLMVDLFDEPAFYPGQRDPRVTWLQSDFAELELDSRSVDRVISTCVFHHLNKPFEALYNIRRILKPGGLFSLFLPSDPGMLTRLNRELIVKPRAKRLGFEKYDLMASLEHQNHYWGLKTMVSEVFNDCPISQKYFPFGINSGNLSLYSIWQIRTPHDSTLNQW